MLYISSFTFGGGFVIATLMKKKFVDKMNLFSENEMLDFIALGQSAPGAIAVNTAILVGWNTAGFIGMISAVAGTVIPPVVILSIVSVFYKIFSENIYVAMMLKGMQAGVAAVIADVVTDMCIKTRTGKKLLPTIVTCLSFIAVFFLKINVVIVIVAVITAASLYVAITSKKEKAK